MDHRRRKRFFIVRRNIRFYKWHVFDHYYLKVLYVVHHHLASLHSLLHVCPIDSVHLVHRGSNSTGEFQNAGNKVRIWFFRSCTSCSGRPGSPRSPATVHFTMTASPKNDSLASLSASVGALLSQISLGFLSMTTLAATSLVQSITDDGRYSWLAFVRFRLRFEVTWASAPRSCALSGWSGGWYGVFWWER